MPYLALEMLSAPLLLEKPPRGCVYCCYHPIARSSLPNGRNIHLLWKKYKCLPYYARALLQNKWSNCNCNFRDESKLKLWSQSNLNQLISDTHPANAYLKITRLCLLLMPTRLYSFFDSTATRQSARAPAAFLLLLCSNLCKILFVICVKVL